MARWRLINAHYLHVPETFWEHKETDRSTGKQATKKYPVPMYLDPRDSADHNYPGEIIVTNRVDRAFPKDILFTDGKGGLGEPTPEMEPLDDEAEKINESLQAKWVHPIESLPVTGANIIPAEVAAPKSKPAQEPIRRRA